MVKGKSVLDDSFEEFEKDNHEFVEPGEEENAEKAAFEKDKAHAIKIMQIQQKHTKRLCTLEYLN